MVHQRVNATRRSSIINLSVTGSGFDARIEAILESLYKLRVPVVVSAGNFNRDACSYYPAKSPFVITVGALSALSDDILDSPPSNWGNCVHVYAPGQWIKSLQPGNSTRSLRYI